MRPWNATLAATDNRIFRTAPAIALPCPCSTSTWHSCETISGFGRFPGIPWSV